MKQIKKLADLLEAEQNYLFEELSDEMKLKRVCNSIKVRGERTFEFKDYKKFIKSIDDFSIQATSIHNAFAEFYSRSNLKRRKYLTYLVIFSKISKSTENNISKKSRELEKIFYLAENSIRRAYVEMSSLFKDLDPQKIETELKLYNIGQ